MRSYQLWALCALIVGVARVQSAKVIDLTVREGSKRGATRVSVRGEGFITEPIPGPNGVMISTSKVWFIDNNRMIPCDVENDASFEQMIACYTRPMPVNVRMYVYVETNGEVLHGTNCNNNYKSGACSFTARDHFTPHLTNCYMNTTDQYPNTYSGPRGSFVTCLGKIFTTRYGSGNDSDETGTDTTFRRVNIGERTCELKEGDRKYGMWITSGDWGGFTCKFDGSLVGIYNASMILTGNYGRNTFDRNVYKVSGNDKVYMLQSYAVIDSVSPSSGSKAGGTILTICGKHLDATNSEVEIFVGGVKCDVVAGSNVDGCVKCVTRPEQENKPDYYTGSRGVVSEQWMGVFPNDVAEITTFNGSKEGYLAPRVIDQSGFIYDDATDGEDQHSGRFTGVFVAPTTGKFQFQFKSDDAGALYMNCDGGKANTSHRIAFAPHYKPHFDTPDQFSEWMDFNKGDKCHFVSVVRDGASHANMYVAVLKGETKLTNAQSPQVQNEIQEIDFHSSHKGEIQSITFNNMPTREGVKEQQKISVVASCTGCGFYLSFNGARSAKLSATVPKATLQQELRKMHKLKTVSVTELSDVFIIEFSEFGPQPLLIATEDDGVTVVINKQIVGQSTFDVYSLKIGNRIISNIPRNDGEDHTTLTDGLNNLKKAVCPASILPPLTKFGVVLVQDYEIPKAGSEYGYRKVDFEPFCGTTSNYLCDRIYRKGYTGIRNVKGEVVRHSGFDAYQSKWLCLAHKGFMHTHLYIGGRFKRTGGEFNAGVWAPIVTDPAHPWEESDNWRYHCINLLQMMENYYSELSMATIHEIRVSRGQRSQVYYVDAIVISGDQLVKTTKEEEDLLASRIAPLMSNTFPIEKFFVRDDPEKNDTLEIEMHPYKCGTNLPLVEILGTTKTVDTDDSTTQRNEDWPVDANVEIIRKQDAVPPLSGTFDITVQDDLGNPVLLEDISVDISNADFELLLQSVPGFGKAKVTRQNLCYRMDFLIEWTTNGGDKPEIHLNASKVYGPTDLTARIYTKQDGGVFYNPISGEMLRQAYSEPQVEVIVEGFPSKCSADCSFTFEDSATPIVTDITPLTGIAGTLATVHITGTGLGALNSAPSSVMIGTSSCEITASSDTSITCDVTSEIAGSHNVVIMIGDKGYPKLAGGVSNSFAITGVITSIAPTEGLISGGMDVTISGKGFSDSTVFKVGATEFTSCVVADATSATCVVPSAEAAGSVSVSAEVDSIPFTSSTTFTYSSTGLPHMASISDTTAGMMGGESRTVAGTSFGSEQGKVFIGDSQATVDMWTDTQVDVTLSPLSPGTHAVTLEVAGGLATGSVSVSVTFEVTGFSPKSGSIVGGTMLTFNGNGFLGSASEYNITIGSNETPCTDVEIISSTELQCLTGFLPQKHMVTTNMDSIESGIKWDKLYLQIYAHDTVTWTWDLKVDPYSPFGVRLFLEDNEEEYFESSEKRKLKHTFSHTFPNPGTYKINTDLLDGDAWGWYTLPMTIDVYPVSSRENVISVKAYGNEAMFTESVSSRKKRAVGSCAGINQIDGCTPATLSTASNVFTSDTCKTPTVTSMSLQEGTSATEITFIGTGFAAEQCANKIRLGHSSNEFPCEVTSASTTELKCKPKPLNTTDMYTVYPASINVQDLGLAAVLTPNYTFALKPNLELLTPAKGSLNGGSRLTLTGNGFTSDHVVSVYGKACDIMEQDYFTITCVTNSNDEGIYDVVVEEVGYPPVECSGTCTFEYATDSTPTLTSVTPDVVNSLDQSLAFESTLLGTNTDDITIFVGEIECSVTSATSTGFTCTLPHLPGGSYVVTAIGTNGKAVLATPITSSAVVTAVSPKVGSIYGGTMVTISGHGFGEDTDAFSVTLGSNNVCEITALANTQIDCITPAAPTTESVEVEILPSLEGATFTSGIMYSYDATISPTFTSVEPVKGTIGDELTLVGTNLDATTAVMVGEAACAVTQANDTQIKCTAGDSIGGTFAVTGSISGVGAISSNLEFEYEFSAQTVSVASAACTGSYGGGFQVDMVGKGFDENMEVRVCDNLCAQISDIETTRTTHSCKLEREPQLLTSYKPSELVYNGPFWSDSSLHIARVIIDNRLLLNRPLGQVLLAESDLEVGNVPDILTARGLTKNSLAPPVSFENVFPHNNNENGEEVSVWRPIPPPGYVCLGDLFVMGSNAEPTAIDVSCVHRGLVVESTHSETAVWASRESNGGNRKISVWGIEGSNFFSAKQYFNTPDHKPYRLKTEDEMTDFSMDKSCNVSITLGGSFTTVIAEQQCTYEAATTPTVTSFAPLRGGTAGGTTVTIAGTGFAASGNTVGFGGVPCLVSSESETSIECVTESSGGTMEGQPEVNVPGKGLSTWDTADSYQFVDLWSSRFTWGDTEPPVAGDFVVISQGQTVVLDTDTPVLKLVLIDGGKLIFDDKDITLEAENILILKGGLLQIGTEEEPFKHKATIILHGHVRSIELPIYGAKSIGVRHGLLDIHGKHITHTWTRLTLTAIQGATELQVEHPVNDWEVGSSIVLPTTSHRHSMGETETAIISAVSEDGKTITLQQPIAYEHIAEVYTFEDVEVEHRGEVGLLSRNIKIIGSDDQSWHGVIEACPEGFDTGEFATQTCFQGRFGEEIGSDEFGATIMVHPKEKHTNLARAQLEFAEFSYVGQAFRLGRYPIHFHLLGDSKSYVKGCAVHRSFNRALTIHGTNYIKAERNVVHDVKGGAVFIEDGIEHGNKIDQNLVVGTLGSSSLQNDDITPAAFWVTAPDNDLTNNAAAGGSHFGFWYRINEHPDGPSYDPSICQRNTPLGIFRNNTVHSSGWFGLWTFQVYTPKKGGACGATEPEVAHFEGMEVWNCEKGIEAVTVGAVQINAAKVSNNEKAGIEYKQTSDNYLEWGDYGVYNNTIIGRTTVTDGVPGTFVGVVAPFSPGFEAFGNTFVNFDAPDSVAFGVTKIDGKCTFKCGGWTVRMKDTRLINTPNALKLRWEHEIALEDLDGSFSGSPGVVVAQTNLIDSSKCTKVDLMSAGEFDGYRCDPSQKFHRFALNTVLPTSLQGNNITFKRLGSEESSQVDYLKKRLTHKFGWMALLPGQGSYQMSFDNAEHLTNISYHGTFFDFLPDDCIIMTHQLTQKPDYFNIMDGASNQVDDMVTCTQNQNGDFYFDTSNQIVAYVVKGEPQSKRKKRAANSVTPGAVNRDIKFKVYRCYYKDCIPPPDANSQPAPRKQPDDAVLWSSTSIWVFDSDANEFVADKTHASSANLLPSPNSNVRIKSGTWVVIDGDISQLNKVWIEGGLELDNSDSTKVLKISATHIIVLGGNFVVGWEDDAFGAEATVELRGTTLTEDVPIEGGPNLGAKCIGVIGGGLYLHGRDPGQINAKLAKTVEAGSNQITLDKLVNWNAGDTIMLATTGMDPWETESFDITAVGEDTLDSGAVVSQLTLNDSTVYKHKSETWQFGDREVSLKSEVALMSRNVMVIGEESTSTEESFGVRVIVGAAGDSRGYATISNTEFKWCGQISYSENYDPRFCLAYLNTGVQDPTVKPSYAKRNAFSIGYNSALGVFGAEGINIDSNSIYHTVGPAMRVEYSTKTSLTKNLVTLCRTESVYYTIEQDIENWRACIEIQHAPDTSISENTVAGSERAAYRTDGIDCSEGGTVPEGMQYNTGRSSLQGVLLNKDGWPLCTLITKFIIHQAYDVGIFYQGSSVNVKIDDVIVVDSQNGISTITYAPASVSHQMEFKRAEISNSLIVGYTDTENCELMDSNIDFLKNSGLGRAILRENSGKASRTGLLFPLFNSAHNAMPAKPFLNQMSYPGILGGLWLSGVTFANFGEYCGARSQAIMTNTFGEDFMHSIYTSEINFIGVDEDSKIFYHRPSLGKINPADCVDMECDGIKQALVIDQDGSFTGTNAPSSIIPEAEFEWGSQTRGKGDFRIPKTLVSDAQGKKQNLTITPGLERADCVNKPVWQGHLCSTANRAILLLESMDKDHETRRISPISMSTGDYLDLLNGPQDHGWCNGYTCQERLSTFWSIISTEREYKIHFTGTAPKKLRLHLINVDTSVGVLLKIYFSSSLRKDVYLDGEHIEPQPTKPTLSSPSGANSFDRFVTRYLTVSMRGSGFFMIEQPDVIMISFKISVNLEDFYEDDIINRLAQFLGITKSKIKIVRVVRETSRRKKRAVSDVEFAFEIGNEAGETSETVTGNPITTASATTDLAREALEQIESTVKQSFQVNQLSSVLGGSVSGLSMAIAPSGGEHNPNNTETIEDETEIIVIRVPSALKVSNTQPTSGYNGISLNPITVFGVDDTGVKVVLGDAINPWFVRASIYSSDGSSTQLVGHEAKINTEGDAVFGDLKIMSEGSYVLKFQVFIPDAANNLVGLSDVITVTASSTKSTTTVKNDNELTPTVIGVIAGVGVAGLFIIVLTIVICYKFKRAFHSRVFVINETKSVPTVIDEDTGVTVIHYKSTGIDTKIAATNGARAHDHSEFNNSVNYVEAPIKHEVINKAFTNHPEKVSANHYVKQTPPPYEETLPKSEHVYEM